VTIPLGSSRQGQMFGQEGRHMEKRDAYHSTRRPRVRKKREEGLSSFLGCIPKGAQEGRKFVPARRRKTKKEKNTKLDGRILDQLLLEDLEEVNGIREGNRNSMKSERQNGVRGA